MSLFAHPIDSRIAANYELLNRASIYLSEHYTLDDLAQAMKRYNRHSIDEMLEILGGPHGKMPFFHLSNNVWIFDPAGLDDPESYVDFAVRLGTLVHPHLPLSDITSGIDAENRKAWIAFIHEGTEYRWDLRYDPENFDYSLFGNFLKLISPSETGKALAFSSRASIMEILYLTPDEKDLISSLTNKEWNWIGRAEGVTFGS